MAGYLEGVLESQLVNYSIQNWSNFRAFLKDSISVRLGKIPVVT